MNIVTAGSSNVASASDLSAADHWQKSLRDAIRTPEELCDLLQLPPEYVTPAKQASAQFKLFVPREYLAKIPPGEPEHPLLKQVLPLALEESTDEGFSQDPVGDADALVTAGLLQKYASRALLVVTGACAVHCRYCFRRYFPYDEVPKGNENWEPVLDKIQQDPTIDEVILSGGDPWMLVDSRLQSLTDHIARIPHVRRLRIHTRLPIMIPSRITDELLKILTSTRLKSFVVVHINHALEIDDSVTVALTKLIDCGVVVLNQSVLLRGVNDSLTALESLCRDLVNLGVLPYYLHQLDRVKGSGHFEVSDAEALKLISELRCRLPGYAVPRLARERPGGESKDVLA